MGGKVLSGDSWMRDGRQGHGEALSPPPVWRAASLAGASEAPYLPMAGVPGAVSRARAYARAYRHDLSGSGAAGPSLRVKGLWIRAYPKRGHAHEKVNNVRAFSAVSRGAGRLPRTALPLP
jgi:hypothetical protein